MQRSFKIQQALKREKLKRLTPAQIFLASGGGSGGGGEEPGLYVSLNGDGDESGSNSSNSMAVADFLNETLTDGQVVLFKKGDTF